MSRFLFTVWPLTGHIYPNLAMAEELRRMGHGVAFYTGARARQVVEGAGFDCFPFENLDERILDEVVLAPDGILASRGKPGRLREYWRRWVLGTVPAQIQDLERVVAVWPPAAVVCDPTMWGPFLVLHERQALPVAIFSLVPACHLPGPAGPVLGFALPRPSNGYKRARAGLLRKLSHAFLAPVRREASAMRQRYGLSPLDCSVTELAGRMPLYLVPGSPEFDYSRDDLPRSVHYVGCCDWKAPAAEPLPAWVEELPRDQPLVYVSEGTIHLDPRLLRAAAQGLAHLPVQVIITTGRHRDPAALDLGPRPLAPNIHVEQWVTLDGLLPRLSAIATVGGPGTLMPALDAGIPVLIVPFAWDHPETAWRIAESGCGIRLAPRECTPRRVGDAILRLLKEPAFGRNARRVADSFRRCGGPAAAARLIASLGAGRGSEPTSGQVLSRFAIGVAATEGRECR